MLARVRAVRHLRDFVLELEFADGVRGEITLRGWIVGRGGVFESLETPGVLHHAVSGAPLPGSTGDVAECAVQEPR